MSAHVSNGCPAHLVGNCRTFQYPVIAVKIHSCSGGYRIAEFIAHIGGNRVQYAGMHMTGDIYTIQGDAKMLLIGQSTPNSQTDGQSAVFLTVYFK